MVRRVAEPATEGRARAPAAAGPVSDPGRLGERLARLAATLERCYGRPPSPPGRDADPLDVLVKTLLSQATSDINSGRAYDALRSRFPTWEAVLRAPVGEVARAIAGGGLGPTRAARIQAILGRLEKERGRPTLEFLRGWDAQAAREYLLGLPGVGPKTAACVLLFALGRPAFPVDTHVHRLAGRLGLAPERAGPQEVQARLEPQVPPGAALSLHLNLIRHGRRVCRPAAPDCAGCALSSECRAVASAAPRAAPRRGAG